MSDQLQPDLNYIKLWMQYHIDILRKGHPSEVTIDFLQEWMAFCQSQNSAILELVAKVSEQERLLAECATNFDSVAEMVADWGVYAPIYFQEKWNLDGDVAEVREMADKARAATSRTPPDTPDTAPQPPATLVSYRQKTWMT